jgi:arylformamidase
MADRAETFIDLSHVIEAGMVTYKGLPAPVICDYWSREASAENYDDGSSFHIGRLDMVANTGTYIDSPFHRFADGTDLAGLDLTGLAAVPGIVIHAPWQNGLAIDEDVFEGHDIRGKAVLIHTGWDAHWRTDAYFTGHPYLTPEAALRMVTHNVEIVGIDSYNIDNTAVRTRPVHTTLLGAHTPIVEHMTNLAALPDTGFRFYAVPPKIRNFGTFPVRAFARLN